MEIIFLNNQNVLKTEDIRMGKNSTDKFSHYILLKWSVHQSIPATCTLFCVDTCHSMSDALLVLVLLRETDFFELFFQVRCIDFACELISLCGRPHIFGIKALTLLLMY